MSLVSLAKKITVSSVLNSDAKQFGKQNMFDDDEETCWNSHQGVPQSILFEWTNPVDISTVEITFQGGFVGKNCQFLLDDIQTPFFPDDSSNPQIFPIKGQSVSKLKIIFGESTDFFGRITIYKLDIKS